MGLETDLAEFWFEPGLFLDLDDPSVLQRFRTPAGTAADLGSDGMKTTGVLPAVYLTKDFADSGVTFFQNHGYGGGPIEVWETYTPVYGAVQSDPRSAMWCSRSARRPHGGRRSSRSGRPRRTAPDPSVRCPGRNGRADAPGRQGAVRAKALFGLTPAGCIRRLAGAPIRRCSSRWASALPKSAGRGDHPALPLPQPAAGAAGVRGTTTGGFVTAQRPAATP